jgi:hypothetical protein
MLVLVKMINIGVAMVLPSPHRCASGVDRFGARQHRCHIAAG